MSKLIKLQPPLGDRDLEGIEIGDQVLITGVIYSARDTAHRRLTELIKRNEPLPLDIKGQIFYYMGPTPAPPGRPIGAAGPTTSTRMDAYAPLLLEKGLKVMIGKGPRSAAVIEAIKRWGGLYVAATGGAGALLGKKIKKAEIVAFEDLGAEAIRALTVEDFPAIVINDPSGRDLYRENVAKYRRNQEGQVCGLGN